MQLARLLQHLKLDGWCVLEGVIPADQIEHVRHSVEATVAAHRNPAAPPGIGHLPGMINFDQSFAPFLADENLLALVGAMLGPHPRISFTTGTINHSGNERGGWHADWPFNQNNAGHIPAPYPDVTVHLTTLWMLAPFTEENGGTLLGPRQSPVPEQSYRRQWRRSTGPLSHRSKRLRPSRQRARARQPPVARDSPQPLAPTPHFCSRALRPLVAQC